MNSWREGDTEMKYTTAARLVLLTIAMGAMLVHAGEVDGVHRATRPILKDGQGRIQLALTSTAGRFAHVLSEAIVVNGAAQSGTPLDATPEGAVVQFNSFVKAADLAKLREMCNNDSDREFLAAAIEPRIDRLAAARTAAELQLNGRVDCGVGALITGGLRVISTGQQVPTMPVFAVRSENRYRISFAVPIDGGLMQLLSLTGRFNEETGPADVGHLRRLALAPSADLSSLVVAGDDAPFVLHHNVVAFPQPVDVAVYEGADPLLAFMHLVHAAFRDGAKDVISSVLDMENSSFPPPEDKFGWEEHGDKPVTAVGKQDILGVTAIYFRNSGSSRLRIFWVRRVGGNLVCSSVFPFATDIPEFVSLYLRPEWMDIVSSCLVP